MRTIPSVPSMPSSQSLSKLPTMCSSNVSLNTLNQSGSSHALGSLAKSHHHVLSSSKPERAPSLPPRSQQSDSSPSLSFSSRLEDCHQVSKSSPCSPQHTTFKDSSLARMTRRTHYVNVSPRPPPGAKKKANAQSQLKETQHSPTRNSLTHGKAIPPPSITERPRKGSLGALTIMQVNQQPPNERAGESPAALHSMKPASKLLAPAKPLGMKKSFHYRQISVKREKPIRNDTNEELSSDEEESELEWQESSTESGGAFYKRKNLAKSSPNLSDIGRAAKSKHLIHPSSNNPSPEHVSRPFQPHSRYRTASYSKVTVVGVKVQNCPSQGTLDESLDGIDSDAMDEVVFHSPPPPPLSPAATDDEYILPERYVHFLCL